jgi:predicted secreted protein
MDCLAKLGNMQPSSVKMRHMLRFALAPIALQLVLVVLLAPHATQAADRSIKLSQGQRTTVQLDENPTTGYRWQIDRTKSDNLSIVRIDDLGFSAPEGSTRVGASGVHRWNIEGASAGKARIVFEYLRPWEKEAVRHHEISVEVTGR